MQKQIVWKNPEYGNAEGVWKKMHFVHINSIFSHTVIVLLAILVGIMVLLLTVEVKVANDAVIFEIHYKKSHADQLSWNLRDMKSVDVMKFTKDTMRSQPSDAEIANIVDTLANGLGISHIAQSIPLDSSEDYNAQNTPSPRTATAITQKWSDVIHAKGVHVIWRGTWSGMEGIYNFQPKVGKNRFPAGSAATAITDGNTTWLGKTYLYIVNNPTFFQDGDIWAILPERTEGIFQDSTSFLPTTGSGIQANYAQFFNDLKTVSDAAFSRIGKHVITGMTANNFSELNSGWMYGSVPTTANMTVVDHYGINHTPEEMNADIRHIYNTYHQQVFLQEWGDYWNAQLTPADRTEYLRAMYDVLQTLANEHILAGFNYWGGWVNDHEGILQNTNGTYTLNYKGSILAEFFARNPTRIIPPVVVQQIQTATVTTTPTVMVSTTPVTVTPTTTLVTVVDASQPAPAGPTINESSVQITANFSVPETGSASSGSVSPSPSVPLPVTTTPSSTIVALPVPVRVNIIPNINEQIGGTFHTGSLVDDNGTVYLIDTVKKIPFTNYNAFIGLGYSGNNIVKGNSSNYNLTQEYNISSPEQSHPWHGWILNGKIIYYVHESGLIRVPSYKIFLNNGGDKKLLLKANREDIKILNTNRSLPVLKQNDPRVSK